MPVTVRQLLSMPSMRAATPQLLSGSEALDTSVRWVHSSEIFEMGPLLVGREVLLTTGLGIVSSDAGTRRHYLRELIAKDLACLALEVGRSFREVPYELVEEARQHGLPLIALKRVVPFVCICEEANSAIVNSDLRRLTIESQVARVLEDALVAGAGVTDILATVSSSYGIPLTLVTVGGSLVAAAGVEVDPAREPSEPVLQVTVSVHGHQWGRLCARAPTSMSTEEVHGVLERTSGALSLALLASGRSSTDISRQSESLLSDLLESKVSRRADLLIRSNLAGFRPSAESRVMGVAVDAPELSSALALLDRADRESGKSCLRGVVHGEVVGALAVPRSDADPLKTAEAVMDRLVSAFGTSQLLVALGNPVALEDSVAGLSASLNQALDALDLVRSGREFRKDGKPRVVSARSMQLELLLLRQADRTSLRACADDLLRPLVQWDQEHGTSLVATLETYLRLGSSATRASRELHIGRASFYERLARIEDLLDVDIHSPSFHSSLLLATCAHRLLGRADEEAPAR